MNFVNSHLNKYNVPKNLNPMWNIGFILGSLLMFQIMSGVLLVLFYYTYKDGAFYSVRAVGVEPNFGWYVRLYHSAGVSSYFLAMSFHISKGIYYSSKFLPWSWLTGLLIYILSIVVAFVGYVLPDGQMSYWGATVIRNLMDWLGRGNALVFGGNSIGPETLQRFFLIHFLVPFLILIIVVIHIYVLHRNSSSNPLLQSEAYMTERFFPSAFASDVKTFLIMLVLMGFQIGYGVIRMFQSDPDNSVLSNSMVTPSHIVPEWYLLIYYSALKIFPTKVAGLVAIASVMESLLIIVESRVVSPLIASVQYHRSWMLSQVSLMPVLIMLGQIGQMVTNYYLVGLGFVLLLLAFSIIGRILDSNRARC